MSAIQYVFIVTTMPASNASQLSCETSLGAAASMATVNAILTISQPKKPTMAEPADTARFWRAMPRA